jgi:hypothetical protein
MAYNKRLVTTVPHLNGKAGASLKATFLLFTLKK